MLEEFTRYAVLDGTSYRRHAIATIAHELDLDRTTISVRSWQAGGTYVTHQFEGEPARFGMTVEDARRAVLALPEFNVPDPEGAVATLLRLVPDESVPDVLAAVPVWADGHAYLAGDVVSHGEGVWRCLQAHDSQGEWAPGQAPSLWAAVIRPQGDEIAEWQQPDSTNPYMRGDTVTHGGQVWESLVDSNVWRPGDPGTEALWQLVE